MAAGVALVVIVAVDLVGTLVSTARRTGRWWPTNVFYRWSSRAWFWLAARAPSDDQRTRILFVYGPLSILAMLVVWIVLLVLGWALVWQGLREHIQGVERLPSAVYFSGVTLFTVGYGDIVPTSPLGRILVLFEAFMGVITVALVISYLASLYGAFSRRETKLVMLDDLTGEEATGLGLIESYLRYDGMPALCAELHEWEAWCADVIETHAAYPELMLFRSRMLGRSWLSGLSIVTDAAVLIMAAAAEIPGSQPVRLYRRSFILVAGLLQASVTDITEDDVDLLDERGFRQQYEHLASAGLALRPFADAWADVHRLRAAYAPGVRALGRQLLVRPLFRNAPGWVELPPIEDRPS
jgi:hypothetical protein